MIKVTLNRGYYPKQLEIWNWCEQQYGPAWTKNEVGNFECGVWQMSEVFGHQQYTFSNEEDATLFALKWVGTSTTVDN